MAEKDDKEKETRTRVDTRSGEAERDVRTARSSDSDRDRDRDRAYDDDDDRDRSRRRRDFRDTGRSVRRASSDFLTFGCDVLGDLLFGVSEALTPRRRSSRSSSRDDDDDDRSSNCWDQFGFDVRTYNRSERDEDDNRGRGVRYESRSYERSNR